MEIRNLRDIFNSYRQFILNERGVSLIITLLVLTVLLTVSFGITALFLREIKFSRGIENSSIAYFAGDSGIERILWDIRNASPPYNPVAGDRPYVNIPLSNGASFTVEIVSVSPTVQIKSNGTYQETNRAVEISY